MQFINVTGHILWRFVRLWCRRSIARATDAGDVRKLIVVGTSADDRQKKPSHVCSYPKKCLGEHWSIHMMQSLAKKYFKTSKILQQVQNCCGWWCGLIITTIIRLKKSKMKALGISATTGKDHNLPMIFMFVMHLMIFGPYLTVLADWGVIHSLQPLRLN